MNLYKFVFAHLTINSIRKKFKALIQNLSRQIEGEVSYYKSEKEYLIRFNQ